MHMADLKRHVWQSCLFFYTRHPFRDGPGHKNLRSGVKRRGKDFSFSTILSLPIFFIFIYDKKIRKEKSFPKKFCTSHGIFMTWPITKWCREWKKPPTILPRVDVWDAMCISTLNLSRSWNECPNRITAQKVSLFINTSWSVSYGNFCRFFYYYFYF